jgi:hypothetical protein
MRTLALPDDERFLAAARRIEEALETEAIPPVRTACVAFLRLAAEFYGVTCRRCGFFAPVRSKCGKAAGGRSFSGITASMRN